MAAGLAAALYILDALLLNQGIVSLIVGTLALAVGLPWCAWTVFTDRSRLPARARAVILLALVPAAVLGTNHLNESLARRRAEGVIAACDRYKARHGRFPEKLSQLVPEFLPKLKRPKLGLFPSRFQYFASDSRHRLQWTSVPPFLKTYYVLEEQRWGEMDD